MTALARRRVLGAIGACVAAPLIGSVSAAERGDVTGAVARYMVGLRGASLPPDVVKAAKHRILDTIGAMVSGAQMRPGMAAIDYVRGLGGVEQAGIVATGLRTNAVNAAFANAMCAHADETDDFEPVTKAHPGCSAVPAALAMVEKNGGSGMDLIRAVVAGYDLGCRLLMALGPDAVRAGHRSAEGTSSTFCALGAATVLSRLDERQARHALSYAAQQVSGLWSWVSDEEHVEKAFDFSGMGARNGVMAVSMVEAGLTGVADVLDGPHNLFIALSPRPDPSAMIAELGTRFFVTESAIKTYSVGYPNQSALDAMLLLRRQYGLTPDNVRAIKVSLPTDAIGIVADSAMPDVNAAHLVAVALLKGAVSFVDSHDAGLMKRPEVLRIREQIEVVGDAELMDPQAPRGAVVEVTRVDGSRVSHHTRFPPGTRENPLNTEQVNTKVRDLIAPVFGSERVTAVLELGNRLDQLDDARKLASLLG